MRSMREQDRSTATTPIRVMCFYPTLMLDWVPARVA